MVVGAILIYVSMLYSKLSKTKLSEDINPEEFFKLFYSSEKNKNIKKENENKEVKESLPSMNERIKDIDIS